MRKLFLALLAICLNLIPAFAQFPMEQFPNYKDFSIPRPEGSTVIGFDDLRLTDAYLPLYKDGVPTASQAGLYKLYDFFRSDPDGRKEWEQMQKTTVRMISGWDIRKDQEAFMAARYIYPLRLLTQLSLIHIFTGNELVSLFIRGHLRKMAGLPIYFWIHSELRGYDEKHPCGALETAELNKMLGFALAAVRKDMSADEIQDIEHTWYEFGHKTARNWLDEFRPHNWTAVISCGLLYSSLYFHDEACKKRALEGLKFYADTTPEPDGSYAEGYGYLNYPLGQLTQAALVMTPQEIAGTFGSSCFKDCQAWRVYAHLFDIEDDGRPGVMRINYGDNPYGDRTLYGNDVPSYFIKLVYRDGVAAWFRQKYGTHSCMNEFLLSEKLGGGEVKPLSPEEAHLPLVRSFDNGDSYIRSSWDDEGIVLALKSGDCGSRVSYWHARPELHSIALGAYGEYLVVTAGSASYRSRIHNEYDLSTRAANTISIDGMNQKCPLDAVYKEGRWDNRSFWVKGYPHAVVTKCESLPGGGALVRSEATDCYHIEMKEATRVVRFIPEGGFFIVADRMIPADGGKHSFDYRLHLFNRDGKTIITGKPQMLTVSRPKADLYIALKSDARLSFSKNDGYMHHPEGRDYDENGPKQGAPGSAVELDWQAESRALDVCAVLCPRRSGSKAPKIRFSGRYVLVDGKKYDISEMLNTSK